MLCSINQSGQDSYLYLSHKVEVTLNMTDCQFFVSVQHNQKYSVFVLQECFLIQTFLKQFIS